MVSVDYDVEGQTFTSADVCRIAGISNRQLQWWDERSIVSPRHEDHRRVYRFSDVLQVLIVASLRGRGLSLQKIRRVLRLLRHELEHHVPEHGGSGARLYLMTDCHSVSLDGDPQRIVDRLAQTRKPMYLVCLSDLMQRIQPETRRRRESKQLLLF